MSAITAAVRPISKGIDGRPTADELATRRDARLRRRLILSTLATDAQKNLFYFGRPE